MGTDIALVPVSGVGGELSPTPQIGDAQGGGTTTHCAAGCCVGWPPLCGQSGGTIAAAGKRFGGGGGAGDWREHGYVGTLA